MYGPPLYAHSFSHGASAETSATMGDNKRGRGPDSDDDVGESSKRRPKLTVGDGEEGEGGVPSLALYQNEIVLESLPGSTSSYVLRSPSSAPIR